MRSRPLLAAAAVAALALVIAVLAARPHALDGAPADRRAGPPQAAGAPARRPPATVRPDASKRLPRPSRVRPAYPRRPSVALGRPSGGALRRGVRLPAFGPDHVTWDPIHRRAPNRAWRRHGTDRLVRLVLRLAAEHRRAHPAAPRLVIGDLSRPRGGSFGARVSGGLGHASHQNGLDVDVYYPRADRRLRPAVRPGQVDRVLAQDLADRFVAAGARFVFVGPRVRLRGPAGVVQPLAHHDDHLHVRLR